MKLLDIYRKSDGSRFGSIIGICSMFLLASWYLTEHPNMTFWPVTLFCFGMGAAGFVIGGAIGAWLYPPKESDASADRGGSGESA